VKFGGGKHRKTMGFPWDFHGIFMGCSWDLSMFLDITMFKSVFWRVFMDIAI